MTLLALKKVGIFLLSCLLIGTLAFLTHSYSFTLDLTAYHNNTLSPASRELLATLEDPLTLRVYLSPKLPQRKQITQLIQRYQQHKKNISLTFIDPQHDLAATKRLNIGRQGLVLVSYQGRDEKITYLDESSLTNALLQLSQNTQRWVSFLTGHGERDPQGDANADLELFSQELARRKIKTQALNLVQLNRIPDNIALLVLTSPSVALLSGEINLINHYIQQGRNLLILTDPNDTHLKPIMDIIGVNQQSKTLKDTRSKLYGIDDPSFVLVSTYNRHPITKGMKTITVYPQASALTLAQKTHFTTEKLLKIREKSHLVTLGMVLTRNLDQGTQQRIAVIGDGDFLSNTFLGNVGNLEMGLRLFNWLIHDDQFIDIPINISRDKRLELSSLTVGILGIGFLLILPMSLIIIGFLIRFRRKRG